MLRFSETEILRVWETGVAQHPLDRALTILAMAHPEESRERLAQLVIGRRDALLFDVREKNFGPRLHGYTECPACRERLEFGCELSALRVTDMHGLAAQEYELQIGEYALRFRLPTSMDLAALVSCAETHAARQLLLERCLTSLRRNEAELEVLASNLPATVTAIFASEVQARDPQAEVLINLNCAACGHAWQSLFDILTFLWTEIQAQAKRLLREVHALAWAYGWRETDILALHPLRRQMYLEMVR